LKLRPKVKITDTSHWLSRPANRSAIPGLVAECFRTRREYTTVGEFGIALVFALLARTLRRDSWRVAIVGGVAGGASIFVCYAAAFLLTDRLIR